MKLGLGIVWVLAVGCAGSSPPPSKEALELAADASHAADHLWCVEHLATHEAIDTCRAGVRARWAAKDGGGK